MSHREPPSRPVRAETSYERPSETGGQTELATADDSRRPAHSDADRAQSAIGTLLIFIAVLLVAAITAGVLFDVVGLVGTQTEATSAETASQLSDRLDVVAITGTNITETPEGERVVDEVELVVTQAAGSAPINLQNVTVQWISGAGVTLSHEAVADPDEPTFETRPFTDIDDSYPVVTSSDDRFGIQFEPGSEFGEALAEGEQVEVVILSPTGTELSVSFVIPESLLGKESVEL